MATQVPAAGPAALIPAAVLPHIPGCEAGEPPLRVWLLPGSGRQNRSLRIDTQQGSFVLRAPVTADCPPGVARRREFACQAVAAESGIAPRILVADESAGWLLMEFIDATMWQRAHVGVPARLAKLGTRLAQLRKLEVPACDALDIDAIVQGQSARILARDPGAAADLAALRAQALELGAVVMACKATINHGDLNVANMLGDAPCFVDWEYAQLASPLYDLACLLDYYPEIEPHLGVLLGAASLDDPANRELLHVHRRLFAILNTLWSRAQAT